MDDPSQMPASGSDRKSTGQRIVEGWREEYAAKFDSLTDPNLGGTNLYFIQAEHGGPIKIGVARSPQARLSELQVGNPEQLVIRRTVRVNEKAERKIHALFAEHRIRGEWFKAVPALAQMADAIPDAEETAEVIAYPRKPVEAVPDLLWRVTPAA